MTGFSTRHPVGGMGRSVMQGVAVVAIAGLLAGSISLSGCKSTQNGLGGATKGGPTVATINGQVITKNEYDKVHGFFGKLMQVDSNPQLASNPMVTEVLKQMTLNKLVVMALIEQEARKRGVTVNDDDLKAAFEKQQKLAGGAGVLSSLLAKQKMSEDEFKASLKEQILLDKVVAEMAKDTKDSSVLAVKPGDLKAFYVQHSQEFQVPESIRSSHILVKAIEPEIRNELSEKDKNLKGEALDKAVNARLAEQKQKADTLLTEIKGDPAKFEQLAATRNDDTMAGKSKGDLGFMTQQATDPAYWQAIETTPVGKLRPELVKSSFGYHIVWVHDKKPAHKLSFDEARPTIEQQLEQHKKGEFLKTWLTAQQKTATIKIEPAFEPLNAQQLKQRESANGMAAPGGGGVMQPQTQGQSPEGVVGSTPKG